VWWLIVTAFLNGASIGGWMVSAPPFLARNTDPERRTWAFSLSYGSSIGTGALAGLIAEKANTATRAATKTEKL
jgi:MFS family permease